MAKLTRERKVKEKRELKEEKKAAAAAARFAAFRASRLDLLELGIGGGDRARTGDPRRGREERPAGGLIERCGLSSGSHGRAHRERHL